MSAREGFERDLVKCEDMRIHAQRAIDFMGARSLEKFRADTLLQDAVIRCLEVVGEAARLVSEGTRSRSPEVRWKLITGMRHVLAHEYGTVDLKVVYEVVARDLPELVQQLREVIADLESESGWEDSGQEA